MDYNTFYLVIGFWTIILFVSALAEMLKLTGNFFHFSLGAIAAIVAHQLGCDLIVQIIAFAAVAGLSFLVLRPLFIRVADKHATVHEEGLDLLVGLEGKVINKIDMDAGTGRVDINGRPAKAMPVDPQQKYNVGDHIVVTDVDGDMLVVKKAKKRAK